MKKKIQPFENTTDHEIEHNGYIYPSKNYDPGLSSYHAETKHYTLKREGFQDVKLRKILGVWETLSYKNPHTGEERWTKCEFSEKIILMFIEDCGICDDCDVIDNPGCNNCVGS